MEHLSLVRAVARRIHRQMPQHVELEDLISAGMLGLVDASSRFNERKGVTFRTFASFRIRGAILDSLRNSDWSSRELRRKERVLKAAVEALTSRNGRTPSQEEIAEHLALDLATYHRLLGDLNGLKVSSLTLPIEDGDPTEQISSCFDSMIEDPLSQCLNAERRTLTIAAIDSLPERERLVITLYYLEELSTVEIGLTLGIVSSRVSQICAVARQRLRLALQAPSGETALGAVPVSPDYRASSRQSVKKLTGREL